MENRDERGGFQQPDRAQIPAGPAHSQQATDRRRQRTFLSLPLDRSSLSTPHSSKRAKPNSKSSTKTQNSRSCAKHYRSTQKHTRVPSRGVQFSLQSARDELNQREQTQKTLENEYAQRIELYRKLIEDEKQQQTRLRGQIEEAARTAGASQIQAETAGKTLEEARRELNAQQEVVRRKDEEIARLEQEKQGLTLAVHNLMHKVENGGKIERQNDVLGDQAKQTQAQFESFSSSLQERMDAMQKQYEEQLASLRSQLQTAKIESAMQEREEGGPSGTSGAKQLQFQAEQIQSLKVREIEGMEL